MRQIGRMGWVVVLGMALSACAIQHTAPTTITGFTFGYKVSGAEASKVQVFSGAKKTYVTTPENMRIQKATGDGDARVVTHEPPYWVIAGLAAHWILQTTRGAVQVRAPERVASQAKIWEAVNAVNTATPPLVHKTWRWRIPFSSGSARLDDSGFSKLSTIAHRIEHADKVDAVTVTGYTTKSGAVWRNAQIGAERANITAANLSLDGVQGVRNAGWAPGAHGAYAIVEAKVQVRGAAKTIEGGGSKPARLVAALGKTGTAGSGMSGQSAQTSHAKPVQVARLTKAGEHSGPHAAKSIKTTAGAATTGAETQAVLVLRPGELLSGALGGFLHQHHWNAKWESPADYSVQYPAVLTGDSVRDVIRKVTAMWPIHVRLYTENRVAVISGGVQ